MYFFLHLEKKSEYLTTVYHEMCTPFNVSLLQEKGLLGLNCLSLSIWKIYISYKFRKLIKKKRKLHEVPIHL